MNHSLLQISSMTSIESLALSGNPIEDISVKDVSSLVNLKKLRLDNMLLTSFDPTSLFLALPALR